MVCRRRIAFMVLVGFVEWSIMAVKCLTGSAGRLAVKPGVDNKGPPKQKGLGSGPTLVNGTGSASRLIDSVLMTDGAA
jgi:hypothetical protein